MNTHSAVVAGEGIEPSTQGYGPCEIPFLYPAINYFLRAAAAFLAFALRCTEYAIATACFTGFPDFTSAETLRSKQFWEAHFRSGIIIFSFLRWCILWHL